MWEAIEYVVRSKRAEIEPEKAQLDQGKKTIALVANEEFVLVLIDEANKTLLLKPNYDWEKE